MLQRKYKQACTSFHFRSAAMRPAAAVNATGLDETLELDRTIAMMHSNLHSAMRVVSTSGLNSPSNCGSQQSRVAPKPGGVQVVRWLLGTCYLLAESGQQRWLSALNAVCKYSHP